MSLSRPRAVVTLDGQKRTSAEGAVLRVSVSLSLGAHDAAEVVISRISKMTSAAPGSKLEIALGDTDDEQDVWSGEVSSVLASADALVIDGLSGTISLSRTRVSQAYLDQSVGDIVDDLASGADIDQVSGDTKLSAYNVDDRRTVWSHILDLAALVGAEVGASAAGALRFVPVKTGAADVTLRYGADVLAWSSGGAPSPDAPAVAAFGAGSESGAEQWHWIRRSPTAAGGSGPLRIVPALHTKDAAEAMSRALADRAARAARRGRLYLIGQPGLRPGDLIDVSDLPDADLGTLRLLTVAHVIDYRGFFTTVGVEGAGQ